MLYLEKISYGTPTPSKTGCRKPYDTPLLKPGLVFEGGVPLVLVPDPLSQTPPDKMLSNLLSRNIWTAVNLKANVT